MTIRRTLLACAALLVLTASAWGQTTRLSPRAAMLRNDLANGKNDLQQLETHYHLVHNQTGTCVQAIVTLNEGTDAKALDAYGVQTGLQVGNMATALVPVDRYADFVASGLCSHIDLGKEVRPMLDRTRADLGMDYIYHGINLPQGYDGDGVVVGLIDIGFEYCHPAFYDSTGTTLRIKRVWQQNGHIGTTPADFNYGTELISATQIRVARTDDPNQSHGTHTTGIAAGCGGPTGNGSAWRGIAPGADIVLVATNLNEVSIVEGIAYIHRYARSVGKPCVVNISLGSLEGPHDGLSAHDIMLQNYLQGLDSIVVVASAGNEGDAAKHLQKSFSDTDTVVKTYFLDFSMDDNFSTKVDCWGDVGDTFNVGLTAYHGGIYGSIDSTVSVLPMVSTATDSVYDFDVTSATGRDYHCRLSVTHESEYNQRPNVFIHIYRTGRKHATDYFGLTITSRSANVHVWSDYEDFSSDGNPDFADGDDAYTMSGVGGNTDAVITVGSYTTRRRYSSSVDGDVSYFSSHGPTYDGRVKPDICAPGEYLISAVNTPYITNQYFTEKSDSASFNNSTFYYAQMAGTSMSAPVVAGIVALWMQNNPALDVDTVRTLLHSTAWLDTYTGEIPTQGSNIWGWGKANAFGGLPAINVPLHIIELASESQTKGSVAGQGRHPQGPHTIEALPNEGYGFTGWNDGNTDNPRLINLTSDTTFTASFDPLPCDTITNFPWTASFSDGAQLCWERSISRGWSSFGDHLWSYLSSDTSSQLLSPEVLVDGNTLLYYTASATQNDSLTVIIATETGDIDVLAEESYNRDTVEHCVDLSPYAGQVVRFGFRHHYNSNYSSRSYSSINIHAIKIDYLQGIGQANPQSLHIATSGLRFRVIDAPEGQLEVYDMAGRRVLSSANAGGTFTLPTAGVYILRIGNLVGQKIVLVR